MNDVTQMFSQHNHFDLPNFEPPVGLPFPNPLDNADAGMTRRLASNGLGDILHAVTTGELDVKGKDLDDLGKLTHTQLPGKMQDSSINFRTHHYSTGVDKGLGSAHAEGNYDTGRVLGGGGAHVLRDLGQGNTKGLIRDLKDPNNGFNAHLNYTANIGGLHIPVPGALVEPFIG